MHRNFRTVKCMEMRRHFTDHPAKVGESYLEHMRVASGFARTLAKATVACAVHAVVPSMCERTASTAIRELNGRMTAGARADLAPVEPATNPAR
jgi:hypothetical protein